MAQAPSRRWRAGALLLALAALLCVGGFLRLARVDTPQERALVWLWAWQEGRVEFVNSITGRPVTMGFCAPWRFAGFWASTDPGTEEYYTGGDYAWNQRLAGESNKRLVYCSEVGITLTLGGRVFRQQGGCMEAALIWPPQGAP